MRHLLLLAALAVASCAGRSGTSESPPSAGVQRGNPPKQPFGERCVAQPSRSRDGMLVACDDKEFLFIVPGTDWSINEPPVASVIVSASSGPLNLSIRLAGEEETRYELGEHLSAIHRGIASGLAAEGFTVGEGEFEDAPNGHLVLWYEVSATAEDGSRVRMVNAWTALRRSDRRYLDFHVSFTATADDPRWRVPSGMGGPKERLVDLADHFVVTDGKGNLPPQ